MVGDTVPRNIISCLMIIIVEKEKEGFYLIHTHKDSKILSDLFLHNSSLRIFLKGVHD